MKLATWTFAVLSSLLSLGAGARIAKSEVPAAQIGLAAEDASAKQDSSVNWAEANDDHPISGALTTLGPCKKCCKSQCTCACGPAGRFWFSAEELYWWTKGQRTPALVTSGSATDPIPGALGQPGTQTLLGNSLNSIGQFGGRFTAGLWFDEQHTRGFEASYFFLGSRTNSFLAGGSGTPGSPVIARPFLDVTNPNTPFQNSQVISFPRVAAGGLMVNNSTGLQGVGANGLCNLCCCSDRCNGRRLDLIGGFNWTQLRQGLSINEDITVTAGQIGGIPSSGRINLFDGFSTQNNFYGAQIGLGGWWWRNRFFVNGRSLLAVGGTHQQMNISGATLITPASGAPIHATGGLLAQPTNIGSFSRDQFSFMPQLSLNVGYRITDYLWLYGGYTFIYWTNVAQPGHSIDQALNTRQIPTGNLAGPLVGPARPTALFHDTDFWAQGLNFGAMVRY